MPIFPVPPVGPDDGGDIHEVVREIVGNRNYSSPPRPGEGNRPWVTLDTPPGRLRAFIEKLLRR